jgi:hypothetical protein
MGGMPSEITWVYSCSPLEAVDQREPLVDVVDRRDAGHAFGNILAADILHPLP